MMQGTEIQFPRLLLAGVLALAAASCAPDPSAERLDAQDAPPAAALLTPLQDDQGLDRQLQRLLGEMEAGMEGEPDRLLRAEAITDGLMEARRPYDWLATGYDVEARLRQLQAMADRVVAQLRRGAALGDVEEDVQLMVLAVNDLRGQLAAGQGGPAPPLLDSLLQQDPMANARVGGQATRPPPPGADTSAGATQTPSGGGQGGPLGRPVPDSIGTDL